MTTTDRLATAGTALSCGIWTGLYVANPHPIYAGLAVATGLMTLVMGLNP